MIGVGRADEAVVLETARLPGVTERVADPIGVRLRRLARGFRRLRDLVAVLVGAGQEEGLRAALAMEARDRVADDDGARQRVFHAATIQRQRQFLEALHNLLSDDGCGLLF